ncbi:zinc-ribbon and DUF3426 domain-containing protein [Acinetobacter towneri]|uniref:DUF3426 domain-containing protein n=1 Tax=Acinetobacter towneri TaxID=202956 RepID=UPI002DBAD53D|nr:DUF3426 domain-containing protein [Acinetobacter towneri]MEB6564217.1 zinc-ribbon and DUF3426 domain-containing protein [Acinetobacter towneri]
MSDKQTKCPECQTVYKVSVAQLTVAQGMVCCPKCSNNFNALSHLVQAHKQEVSSRSNLQRIQNRSLIPVTEQIPQEQNILDIFQRKVEHSNIDLKTYLNNLNYFSTEPIGTIPAMNLSIQDIEQEKKHSNGYYLLWGIINTLLIGLLVFQILWFNPKFLNSSPALNAVFTQVCQVFKCQSLEERYSLISINRVRVKRIDRLNTQFTGELINYHDKSLALPNIKVTLKENQRALSTYIYSPQEYLVKSLSSIQRIPKNSPFKFDILVPVARNSFDTYSLEIIKP